MSEAEGQEEERDDFDEFESDDGAADYLPDLGSDLEVFVEADFDDDFDDDFEEEVEGEYILDDPEYADGIGEEGNTSEGDADDSSAIDG